MHLVNTIGDSISEKSSRANVLNLFNNGLLTQHQAKLILAATADANYKPLPEQIRDGFRAQLLKQLLLTTMD